jgi:hypothetical protein
MLYSQGPWRFWRDVQVSQWMRSGERQATYRSRPAWGRSANGCPRSRTGSGKRVNSRAQRCWLRFQERPGRCGLRIKRACKCWVGGRTATGWSRDGNDEAAGPWEPHIRSWMTRALFGHLNGGSKEVLASGCGWTWKPCRRLPAGRAALSRRPAGG